MQNNSLNIFELIRNWNDIDFANPGMFYLLILLIPVAGYYIYKHKNSQASIKVSSFMGLNTNIGMRNYLQHLLIVLRLLALALLITAMARPQVTNRWETVDTEGIDIVIALDISSSMLAEDFKPNRLEASKDVAIKFVSGREADRLGLVVFSGESFTQCPLTTNHATLINLFRDIKSGMIEDGTAIGLGLGTAINRLKSSDAKSKVVILLTDGVNNKGQISPVMAAELAKTFGIRVYTIGVGSHGMAPYPFQTPYGTHYRNVEVEIDEQVLKDIARETDGKYFRATDTKALQRIYKEIDKLEKSKIEVKEYSNEQEEYLTFIVWGAILLFAEFLLKNTFFRTVP